MTSSTSHSLSASRLPLGDIKWERERLVRFINFTAWFQSTRITGMLSSPLHLFCVDILFLQLNSTRRLNSSLKFSTGPTHLLRYECCWHLLKVLHGKSTIDLTFLTAVESSEQIAFFLSFFVFLRESIAKAIKHTAQGLGRCRRHWSWHRYRYAVVYMAAFNNVTWLLLQLSHGKAWLCRLSWNWWGVYCSQCSDGFSRWFVSYSAEGGPLQTHSQVRNYGKFCYFKNHEDKFHHFSICLPLQPASLRWLRDSCPVGEPPDFLIPSHLPLLTTQPPRTARTANRGRGYAPVIKEYLNLCT